MVEKIPFKEKKEKCIEWDADGSCAKMIYTDEKGLVFDLRACPLPEREKLKKELKRGMILKESED